MDGVIFIQIWIYVNTKFLKEILPENQSTLFCESIYSLNGHCSDKWIEDWILELEQKIAYWKNLV